MRIVLLTSELPESPSRGGIGTNTAALSRALADRGHDTLVLVLDSSSSEVREGRLTTRRLRYRWLPDRRAELLVNRARLAAASRRFHPDVVHAAEWGALAWAVSRGLSIPVVTRLATPTYLVEELNGRPEDPNSALLRRLERDQARHSRRVYAPSRAIAERVGRDWGLPESRLGIVVNSLDVAAVRRAAGGPVPMALPARFVVFVGRLEHRKGIAVLGPALADVLARNPELHAVVIGREVPGDPSVSQFRAAVAPVAERVHLLGELPPDTALAVAARAEIAVVPSLWESFGYVCVEAMALGLPVVVSRAGGLVEIVEEDESGLVVPPGDVAALAGALHRLANDPPTGRRLAAAGRRRAADFDIGRVVEQLEAELAAAAGASSAAAGSRRFGPEVFHQGYARWFQPDDAANPFQRSYARKRVRVLAEFAQSADLRILDAGGGPGRIAEPLGRRHRVTMCDLSAEMLALARARCGPGVAVVRADARSLPFADGAFDALVAIDLLCHVGQLEPALRELARVLRPGGRLIFDTTNGRPWWVLAHPAYVNWRPRRLVRTMAARGVLPEWPEVRHHLPAEVRTAAAAARLDLRPVAGIGRLGLVKWHVWQAVRAPG